MTPHRVARPISPDMLARIMGEDIGAERNQSAGAGYLLPDGGRTNAPNTLDLISLILAAAFIGFALAVQL